MSTCFVLPNEIKQIVYEQPLHLILFFLIQKQCNNLIHSNINSNYQLPGNTFKNNNCSKAEYGSRGNENEMSTTSITNY